MKTILILLFTSINLMAQELTPDLEIDYPYKSSDYSLSPPYGNESYNWRYVYLEGEPVFQIIQTGDSFTGLEFLPIQ
jgi:hypothetical protein